MYFNHRLLQEAADPSTPLIERLRFLGIYSNNLDEFYRVRVATLTRLVRLARTDPSVYSYYPDNPTKILAQINILASRQQAEFEQLYENIIAELESNKIRLVNETELNREQADYIRHFFRSQLINALNPIILNGKFPELADESIYLMVSFITKNGKRKAYALVEIPANEFSRFLILPDKDEEKCVILLDDVIRFCLPELFASLGYHDFEAYTVKITRDAEMDLEHSANDGLPEKIMRGVKSRKRGNPVRLVYDRCLPKPMLKFIVAKLGFSAKDSLLPGGRYHNFKDFMKFPDIGDGKLTYPPYLPNRVKRIDEAKNMLDLIDRQDLALHFPYQDFSYFIRLLREAAIDPNVKAIKITMYRLASNSRIVKALINAAQNGKQVTAVVELMARFNESDNVNWSQRMQDAGINVIFGLEGLKIHCKLVYIARRGGDMACVCTGNFHEGNAKLYTDVMLMTGNKNIVKEIASAFEFIAHPFREIRLPRLLVSPHDMRKKLYSELRREAKNAIEGKPAYLLCKINHITDLDLIDRIIAAAKAGVKVRMLVRGNCSLKPNLSDNIEVTGIIDRYLEHSRIFIFGNGGDESCYISSADWMTRNLDHRIEVAVPVYDEEIKNHLKKIIEYGLRDNVKARIVDGSGENNFKTAAPDEIRFRSQEELQKFYAD
jgi:polyphosphate kinase